MRHDSDLSREMVFGNEMSTFEIEMSTFFCRNRAHSAALRATSLAQVGHAPVYSQISFSTSIIGIKLGKKYIILFFCN